MYKNIQNYSRYIKILIFSICLIFISFFLWRSINSQKTIIVVGKENIYQQDLDYAYSRFPKSPNISEEKQQAIKEKIKTNLIDQSITLQAGEAQGLVELNPNIFNSTRKDYQERYEAVKKIKQQIEQQSIAYEGSYIAVWFVNDIVGELGYTKSKQIAYQTIKPIYDQVKSGQITMKQAGELIASDESLQKIDPNYKGHAYYEFEASVNKTITFNASFNKIIKQTPAGEITPLYLAKDNTQNLGYVDAVYIFAQVNKNQITKIANYDEWLTTQKSNYAIKQI